MTVCTFRKKMTDSRFVLLLMLFSLCEGRTAKLPDEFQRCHRSDPDMDTCLTEAIESALHLLSTKGVSYLGIAALDPIDITEVHIGEGASAVNLVQNYYNLKFHGIKDSKIVDAHMDFEKLTLTFTLKGDIVLNSKYNLTGKVMLLPVYGEGDSTIKFAKECPRCRLKDPNFDDCLTNAIVVASVLYGDTGLPDLGVPCLEPGRLDELFIRAGGGPVGFDQHYWDVDLYGITKMEISKAHVDLDRKTLVFNSFGDLTQNARYNFSGKLLMLPINGHGNSSITFYKTNLKHTLKFRPEVRDGRTYFMMDDYNLELNVTDHAFFYLENLFSGDKTMSKILLDMANENWKDIVDDVKDGIAYGYSRLGLKIATAIFNQIPVDDIFLKD